MSITNLGNQHTIFEYKSPATGAEFSQFCRNVLKPGIYSGGTVTASGNDLTLAAFYAIFNVDSDKIINSTPSELKAMGIACELVTKSDLNK